MSFCLRFAFVPTWTAVVVGIGSGDEGGSGQWLDVDVEVAMVVVPSPASAAVAVADANVGGHWSGSWRDSGSGQWAVTTMGVTVGWKWRRRRWW